MHVLPLINDSLSMVVLIVIIIGFFLVKLGDWRKRKREHELGYKIEYISENVLRGKDKQFAIVYHEKDKSWWFYGEARGADLILDFSESENEKIFKEDDDRKLIKQRIVSEYKDKARNRIKFRGEAL